MSAEPLAPSPASRRGGHVAPPGRPPRAGRARLVPVDTVPPPARRAPEPPTVSFARPATAAAPAAPAPGPEGRAAETVRTTWAALEPREDEVARWFGALLFSIDPPLRALFPASVDGPVRRLVRATVLAMSSVGRRDELDALVAAQVAEHRGLGLTAAAYESIGIALVAAVRRFATDPRGPGEVVWDDAVEQAWVQAFSLAAAPMEDAAHRAEGGEPATVDATLVAHRRLSWDLAVVTVEPHAPVAYRAGQYVSVEIPQRPRMWRRLSPATAPRADGLLEFHVRAVEGGWVSRAMVAHAQRGDRWRIGSAQGRLTVDPASGRDLLMVAGGTGAAPLLALCEDMAGWTTRPVTTVFLGGRTVADLHCLDRFTELARDDDQLRVVAVCEDDPLDPEVAPGTLPEAVVRTGDWSGHDVLLSGSPAMIRATVSALLVDGTSLDRIRYDPFTD